MTDNINFSEKFDQFDKYWPPKIIGEINHGTDNGA